MGLRSGPGLCGSCVRQRPPLDRALAAVPYAYPWSTLISGYKFGEQPGWAAFFAHMLLQTPGVPQALGELEGRRVVLVDDVMTSGASLFTAARALRKAGAAHITAVVLARTE